MLLAPVLAQSVTVTTDKDFYSAGDSLIVSGTVSPVVAGQLVSIQVFDPNNNPKTVDQITPNPDGSYSKNILTFSDRDPVGDWRVVANYMGQSAQKTFSFGVAPITVQTDKPQYSPGDTLIVSGKVSRIVTGQQIAIQVLDPLGSPKAVAQLPPRADLTYTVSVTVFKLEDLPGKWTVRASYLGASATATFELITDTEKPSIVGVKSDKAWYKGGAVINLEVVANDNIGVTSVTAKLGLTSSSLTLVSGTAKAGTWRGSIVAPSTEGKYDITIEASDAGKNTASSSITVNVDNTPPIITITSPTDGKTFYVSSITVEGSVTDNSPTVKSVTIDGKSVDLVAGGFRSSIILSEGRNTITVTATDEAGNTAKKSVSVELKTVQLIVQVITAENYNPGDKARIFVSTYLSDGTLVNADIKTTHLFRPDGQLISTFGTANTIHPGWRYYEITIPDIPGTYGVHIIASFEGLTAHGWWKFEVKPALTQDIDRVRTQVSELSTAVSRVNSAVADLSGKLDQTRAAQDTLRSDINNLNGKLSDLQASLSRDISGVRDSLNSAINSLSGKIDDTRNSLTNQVNNAINTIKAGIDSATAGVAQIATYALVAAIAASISAVLAIAILVLRRR
ncbi:Bacillopeptidase F [archaeon HR06]|nr:Bacillopeptidase F [archaeon HR06]